MEIADVKVADLAVVVLWGEALGHWNHLEVNGLTANLQIVVESILDFIKVKPSTATTTQLLPTTISTQII